MKEQRKLKRRHLILNLEIIDKKIGKTLGYLGDLSIEGLLILTNKPIPLNKTFQIELLLPEKEEFGKESIPLKIKTKWRHEDINPDITDTGHEILEIAPKDVTVINELIEFLGFNY